jgi:hypothetical protein
LSGSEELARSRDRRVSSDPASEQQTGKVSLGNRRRSSRATAKAPGKKRTTKRLLIVLALAALLVVVGVMAWRRADTASEDVDVTTVLGDLPVTATELFAAYQANEAAAQQQYGDVPLLVSGTVDSVTLDILNKPVVKLRTPDESMSMQAGLTEASQPKASKLSPGDQVTLRCTGASTPTGAPALEHCDIQ